MSKISDLIIEAQEEGRRPSLQSPAHPTSAHPGSTYPNSTAPAWLRPDPVLFFQHFNALLAKIGDYRQRLGIKNGLDTDSPDAITKFAEYYGSDPARLSRAINTAFRKCLPAARIVANDYTLLGEPISTNDLINLLAIHPTRNLRSRAKKAMKRNNFLHLSDLPTLL